MTVDIPGKAGLDILSRVNASLSRGGTVHQTLTQRGDAESRLSKNVNGHADTSIALAVGIERSDVRLASQDTKSQMVLRVTLAFRREDGQWKLIHRHADPLTERTIPAPVVQQ